MNITLEQSLASAVRYIQDHTKEGTALYFDEIPERFLVPSVYFPVPRSESKRATLQTYLTTIRMEAWFFAATDWQSYADAAYMRDCIVLDHCCIPIVNEDGTMGRGLYVSDPEVSRVDERVTKLAFQIRHYFSKAGVEETKAGKMVLAIGTKPEELYGAWKAATKEQRKEEEGQKECLRKAVENLQP